VREGGRERGREEGREGGNTCLCGGYDVRLILSIEGANGEPLHGQVPAEGVRGGGVQETIVWDI